MREILFRGKAKANDCCKDGGYWVEGSLFIVYYTSKDPLRIDEKVCISMNGEDTIEVDPETVSEYTGLKERSSKCIFEGDIVRFDFEDDEGNYSPDDYLIFFKDGAFRAQYLRNREGDPYELDDICIDEGYVVGNKWDNPELLEVEK